MAGDVLIPNGLRDERLAAGIESCERLAALADIDLEWYEHLEAGRVLPSAAELERLRAALGGIPAERLYALAYLVANGSHVTDYYQGDTTPSFMYRSFADTCHLLLSRDELTWFERQPGKDHQVDVFVSMSCGPQRTPHLLLDTVAVMERLGVSFIAASGSATCCGSPLMNSGHPEAAERVRQAQIRRGLTWGARVRVNWCGSCQVRLTTVAATRHHADGVPHPIREVQLLNFLEERVRGLGDRVPWKRRVPRRVLMEGHPDASDIHRDYWQAGANLLELIPGVEVVGLHDSGSVIDSEDSDPDGVQFPCKIFGQATVDDIRRQRTALATHMRERGVDTVSCQHQNCHLKWSRYVSDELSVRHAVSILAEALDCAHPDRFQAAVRLGDPEKFVDQTRSIWQSWDMAESRARELAASISDPKYADDETLCSCDGDSCRGNLISVDVLRGTSRPVTVATSEATAT